MYTHYPFVLLPAIAVNKSTINELQVVRNQQFISFNHKGISFFLQKNTMQIYLQDALLEKRHSRMFHHRYVKFTVGISSTGRFVKFLTTILGATNISVVFLKRCAHLYGFHLTTKLTFDALKLTVPFIFIFCILFALQ